MAGLADHKSHQVPPVFPELDGGFYYTGSFWLIKTDALGNVQWNHTYGGEGVDIACSLIATSDGGYALAGERDNDFWLVKTNAQGEMEWNQTYGGEALDVAESLVATSDGGYVLAGSALLVKTDAVGRLQWNKTYPECGINSLTTTSDGGYAIAGFMGLHGSNDFWLTKTDASGNTVWNQTYGGTGHDVAYALVAASDGGYTMAGTWNYTDPIWRGLDFAIPGDFFLVKTDGLGVVPESFSLVAVSLMLGTLMPVVVFRERLFRKKPHSR
jgi:hypothetical protein